MLKARALFDFDAVPENEEIYLSAGEIVTVINQDVGEGWWQGTNSKGETGLFPQDFVEIYDTSNDGSYSTATTNDPWSDVESGISGGNTIVNKPPEINVEPTLDNEDDYDSDGRLEDEDSDGDSNLFQNNFKVRDGTFMDNDTTSVKRSDSTKLGSNENLSSSFRGRRNSVSSIATFNRFSTFVKSGGEDYIFGKVDAEVQEEGMIQIVDNDDETYTWLNAEPSYSCTLSSPRKGEKFKGLKSFTSYQLTPSFSGLQVSRRYKRFDWLHKQLMGKFTMLAIPPLPDKQVLGRYEEEFIDHRMKLLQGFVDRICSHPVLSQSEVV